MLGSLRFLGNSQRASQERLGGIILALCLKQLPKPVKARSNLHAVVRVGPRLNRQRESREYDEFLRRKVEAGRASMRAGLGRSNDEVEAEFAARRASVASQA